MSLGPLDSTRYLINPHTIATMQPHALVIDAHGGGVIDEAAVLSVLDVFRATP